MARRVAYLGPEGTYTDEAAYLYAPTGERIPYPTLTHVVAAVQDGDVDEAVAPIENSLIGTVLPVVDFLIASDRVKIVGELLLPIDACLIVRSGTQISDIRVVRSKPEALGQCLLYLREHLPDAEQEGTASTAAAVQELVDADKTVAAIGPRRAAELAGMEVLAAGIQDSKNNVTRFAVIGTWSPKRSGKDKTSIVFNFDQADAPGLVYAALKPFTDRHINLTKIESRPTGTMLGTYHFLLDFDGHIEDEIVMAAMADLQRYTAMCKVLGSYPKATLP